MKYKLLTRLTAVAVILPSLVISTVAIQGFSATTARAAEEPVCSAITLTSGADTQTAGYTETDPASAPDALQASAYSGGSFQAATATDTVIPPWLNPATDATFTGSGAAWVSTDASWPGGEGNDEGSASNDQWRLFHHAFTLPSGAEVTSAELSYSADNAAQAYLNGASISSTGGVYGAVSDTSPTNFAEVTTASFAPTAGANSLDFVVRNWAGTSDTNPTGLLYKAVVNYCVPAEQPADTFTVTVAKYVNGSMATAETANDASFSMNATWDAQNTGSGSGTFSLSADSDTPYEMVTTAMSSGASYSTNEVLSGDQTGASCDEGKPFALMGYTSGDTMEAAASATPSLTAPSFTNMTGNKFVIVWNRDCSEPFNVKVHVQKRIDGELATATSADNYLFPVSATYRAANQNDNATTTTTFTLGHNEGGASDLYGADSVALQAPAYFTVSETTGGDTRNLPVGATCTDGKFRLSGYRSSSVSFADAAQAQLQTDAPVLQNIQGDRYVIVENETCSSASNDGSLHVTGVDLLNNTATADGTFENGWRYLFHITIPDNETNLAMKFSNWLQSNESDTLLVADNMRISSHQANNDNATVTLTAPNTYSSPALVMTGDLDSGLAGKQVEVLVEVRIPQNTPNGSYSTTYGVRTLP